MKHYIVYSEKRRCYFKMSEDDLRVNTLDYENLGEIKSSTKSISKNGFNTNNIVTDKGDTFEVFYDWSANKL